MQPTNAFPARTRRGFVLLMSLAVLAIMSVLAVSFVNLARLERNISRNYVINVRAQLAAESGVEYAVSRLMSVAGTVPESDFNDALEYIPGATPGLKNAQQVSFSLPDHPNKSGGVEGSSSVDDSWFALRVQMEDAKLNLNDSNARWNIDTDCEPDGGSDDLDLDTEDYETDRLFAALRALLEILSADTDSPLAGVDAFYVAATVFDERERNFGGRFTDMDDVRRILTAPASGVPAMTNEQFDELERFVTVTSWQDPNTVRPNFKCVISVPDVAGVGGYPWPNPRPIPTLYTDQLPIENEMLPMRYWDDATEDYIYGEEVAWSAYGYRSFITEGKRDWSHDMFLWRDFQTRAFELEPRCPVNVNYAPAELLEALIQPLQGWYLREGPGSTTSTQMPCSGDGFFEQYMKFYHELPSTHPFERLPFTMKFQYFWEDIRQPGNTGRWKMDMPFGDPDMGFKDPTVTRLGQAFLTPELSVLIAEYDENHDGEIDEVPLPRALARRLYDQTHGVDLNGDGLYTAPQEREPDPIETWQEFELVLELILEEFFPKPSANGGTAELAAFWQEQWCPQPIFYDMRSIVGSPYDILNGAPRVGYLASFMGVSGTSPYSSLATHAFAVDNDYWQAHCREILRDLFVAAFNPNTRLNDYNSDRTHNLRIDKTQLTRYSTELSLQPTGTFSIQSLGVVEEGDAIFAASELSAVVEIFQPFRITTQAQFMKGFTPGTGMQSYSPAPNEDVSLPTAWNTRIMSYPEPILQQGDTDDPIADGQYFADSRFDGYLGLSTWELNGDPDSSARMVLPFDGRLLPQYPESISSPDEFRLLRGVPEKTWAWEAQWPNVALAWTAATAGGMECWQIHNQPTTERLTSAASAGVGPLPLPGALLPDGAMSDVTRAIAFKARHNGRDYVGSVGGRKGAVQFWFKPNFDPECTSRPRQLFGLDRNLGNTDTPGVSTVISNLEHKHLSVYFLPHYRVAGTSELPINIGGSWARRMTTDCVRMTLFNWNPGNLEASISVPTTVKDWPNNRDVNLNGHATYQLGAHEWSHLLCAWNMDPAAYFAEPNLTTNSNLFTNRSKFFYVQLNGKDPIENDGPSCGLDSHLSYSNLLGQSCYVLEQGEPAVTALRFGGNASGESNNYTGDITVDEVVTYTEYMDNSGNMTMPFADKEVYTEVGRYYKPEDVTCHPFYISPTWDLFQELKTRRASLDVISVAWTAYWPLHNLRVNYGGAPGQRIENEGVTPMNINNNDRPDPLATLLGVGTPLAAKYGPSNLLLNTDKWGWEENFDPMSVDVGVIDAAGNERWAVSGPGSALQMGTLADTFAYAGGSRLRNLADKSPVRLRQSDSLRFRVFFNVPYEVNTGEVLYETPILDDITFFVAVHRVLRWKINN